MNIYSGSRWRTGYLDESVPTGSSRVVVHRQVALCRSTDQFFERPRNARMLWTYFRSLGLIEVVRKVRSRSREAVRNDVWLSVGVGIASINGEPECTVQFFLTSHPLGIERAVVPNTLLKKCDEDELRVEAAHYGPLADIDSSVSEVCDELSTREVLSLQGWHPESREAAIVSEASWTLALELVRHPPDKRFERLGRAPASSSCREGVDEALRQIGGRSLGPFRPDDQPTYTCFGYGQYSKTQVLPNLSRHLKLVSVHEINPLQVGPIERFRKHGWDTSPTPRAGERIDNVAIASYHHTHSDLAVALIETGTRHVVLEKPVAVDAIQLEQLVSVARKHDARIHCAFQRRYSILTEHLRADMGVGPVSMACSVFEVPLPSRHWYRWPVSGGPIIANGCHWIDHFLFVNEFAPFVDLDARQLPDQYVLTLVLANGASGVISLRHSGSARRGVREVCQFWNGTRTATIEDMHRYSAETTDRIVRKDRVHPYEAYKRMYSTISQRIKLDQCGDDLECVKATGLAAIELANLADNDDARLYEARRGSEV